MAWFDKGGIPSPEPKAETEVFESVSLSNKGLHDIADYMGVQVTKDDTGSYVSLPPGINTKHKGFNQQFIDYWVQPHEDKANIEQRRKTRYSSYRLMDEILGEAILTLDTYADEAVGLGFIEQPIDIQFSDEAVGESVLNILKRNEIIKRSRSHIRNLLKWGDLGYKILCPQNSDDPEEIRLESITPDKWEAVIPKQQKIAIAYSLITNQRGNRRRKGQTLQPWEFVHITVPDEEFKPYGRSLLEAMRTPFDQLVTIEALLALSRASRVERLIIKVPTNQQNPTAALAKMNQLKSVWKNVIFSESAGGGRRSHGRTPSLQDIMFIPSDEGFGIEKLSSNVDISSTEDVEYFRDKVLTMTGLPKGYFLADDTTDRGNALANQDLKFARKLIPFQDAYATGLVKLCMVLAAYVGADISTLDITVKIKRPTQLSVQLLENYSAISNLGAQLIDNYKRSGEKATIEGVETPDVDIGLYAQVMGELGMPEDLVRLFSGVTAISKPNSTDDDDTQTQKSAFTGDVERYFTSVNSKDVLIAEHDYFEKYTLNMELKG